MVWFRVIWLGASYANFRQLHILKRQMSVKNLVLHSSKYGILSFDNHLLEHGLCRLKHVGEMSCIYKLLSFYCCAVGTNIVKSFT